ncbi:MAG: hypothetical protein MK102_01215 [Fuerstiella sp.]|nr:hypothetical protein [Fuerstiella sp.]
MAPRRTDIRSSGASIPSDFLAENILSVTHGLRHATPPSEPQRNSEPLRGKWRNYGTPSPTEGKAERVVRLFCPEIRDERAE